jgi:hypothetical protein
MNLYASIHAHVKALKSYTQPRTIKINNSKGGGSQIPIYPLKLEYKQQDNNTNIHCLNNPVTLS